MEGYINGDSHSLAKEFVFNESACEVYGQRPTADTDIVPETDFWQKLVSSGMSDFEVHILGEEDQQGLHWERRSRVKKISL